MGTDGHLSEAEKQGLADIAARHADKMDPADRKRLEAFVAGGDEALRNFALQMARSGAKGGSYRRSDVIDTKEAVRLQQSALADGVIDGDERAALGSVHGGMQLTDGARAVLGPLAAGGSPLSLRTTELLSARENAGYGFKYADDETDQTVLLIEVAARGRNAKVPVAMLKDEDFVAAAYRANVEFVGKVDPFSPRLVEVALELLAAGKLEASDIDIPVDLTLPSDLLGRVLDEGPQAINWSKSPLGNDRDIVLRALQHGSTRLPEQWRGDRTLMRLYLANNPHGFRTLSEDDRRDPEYAAIAIEHRPHNLEFLPPPLNDDPALAASAIERNPRMLKHAGPKSKKNKDIVLSAIRADGNLLQYAPDFLDNKRMVLTALRTGARFFSKLPQKFQDDEAVVKKALVHDGNLIKHVSGRLRKRKSVVLLALKNAGKDDSPSRRSFPDAWFSKRSFVDDVMAIRPGFLNWMDKDIRNDPKVAMQALANTTRFGYNATADLRADPDFMRGALAIRPDLLEDAAETIQKSPEHVLIAAKADPSVLGDLDDRDEDGLLNNAAFADKLLGESGAFYPYFHENIRADRDRALKALDDLPYLSREFPDVLCDDREVMEKAIDLIPGAYGQASDRLKADKTLALKAVEGSWLYLRSVPDELKKDPEVALAAIKGAHRAFAHVDASLQKDKAFLIEAAKTNPLVLDFLPQKRSELFAAVPGLEDRYVTLRAALDELDIEFPERIPPHLLDEIIKNRREPRAKGDDRPLALMVYPKDDDNHAFTFTSTEALSEHHRVVYFEVGSDRELADVMNAVDEPAAILEIAGHGTQRLVAFGADDPAGGGDLDDDEAYLDIDDAPILKDAFAGAVVDGGHVVVHSCSTGAGEKGAPNVANFLADMIPNASVHAPTVPSNNQMVLGDKGEFIDAGNWHGAAYTYTVPAKGPNGFS